MYGSHTAQGQIVTAIEPESPINDIGVYSNTGKITVGVAVQCIPLAYACHIYDGTVLHIYCVATLL